MQDRDQRFPSDVAVRVFVGERQFRAFSINVSANGACLTGLGKIEAGADVVVRYLHLSLHGRVAWSSELATGVQFRKPLAPIDLDKLRCGQLMP